MLRITEAQLDLLWLEGFADRVVPHLRHYFEKPCAMAGEEAVRAVVRLGVAKARHYGFTLEASAQSYIDHMVMLGSHFDTDPQLPWARQILRGDGSELARMDALHARTLPFVAQTAGEHARSLFFAVVRARRQGLHPNLEVRPHEAVAQVETWLSGLYPQRFEQVRDGLVPLIRRAEDECEAAGLHAPRVMYRVLGLQFLLGHGILDDPMAPGIGEGLRDTTQPPEQREARLWARVETFADRWIATAREEGETIDVR